MIPVPEELSSDFPLFNLLSSYSNADETFPSELDVAIPQSELTRG